MRIIRPFLHVWGLLLAAATAWPILACGSNADLVITCRNLADPIILGDLYSYRVTVSNAGPDTTVSSCAVTNWLPAGVTFVSYSSTMGPVLSEPSPGVGCKRRKWTDAGRDVDSTLLPSSS